MPHEPRATDNFEGAACCAPTGPQHHRSGCGMITNASMVSMDVARHYVECAVVLGL